LRVRRDLKKKIESRVKEITGLEIGTKDYDLYSKEVIELTGVDSAGRTKPIKVRRYELLDILASMRDPSNLKRAVNSGGYVIDRLDLAEVDTVKITPETYIEILNKATDQDNQMVDMMVDLYNNDLFQVLENASVQAYGHGIKAVSGTYYPRTADKWTRATEVKKDLDYIAYYQRRVDDWGILTHCPRYRNGSWRPRHRPPIGFQDWRGWVNYDPRDGEAADNPSRWNSRWPSLYVGW